MASVKTRIKRTGLRLFERAVHTCFPVNRKKVIFSSFLGKSYSCNPRAISEKLHELDPTVQHVWCFADPKAKKAVVPPYVKCVRFNSLRMYFHQMTAGFWIDNYTKMLSLKKRKDQYYIQTWHGDRGLKKVLGDMYDNPKDYRLYESDHCDLTLAGSTFSENQYASAFVYHGEILKTGIPRNDILINGNPQAVADFRKQYNVPEGVKLLLYAPTFRDSNKTQTQTLNALNMRHVLDAFEENTGDKWMLMLRGHTGRQLVVEGVSPEELVDATNHEDSQYVLLAADAAISDYSSIVTDFILQDRPTFLYIADVEEYEQNSRSLPFRIEDSPFWYAHTESQLLDLIRNCTPERAAENCRAILNFYGAYETGKASDAACQYILERMH